MFDKNYFDLEQLVRQACEYCGVTQNSDLYSQVFLWCKKYFWGEITKPEFQVEIDKLRGGNKNV